MQAADGGRPRRVMLGWLQNGCSSRGSGIQDGAENSLTLPRELSLAPNPTTAAATVAVNGAINDDDGAATTDDSVAAADGGGADHDDGDDGVGLGGMRQRYIPELQALRDGPPHTITAMPFPPPPTAAAAAAGDGAGSAAGSSSRMTIEGVSGAQLEISATIK
eukprot:COSAG06_NODE_4363_length_4329_cov_64.791962_5_plen_163_part_00